MIELIISKRADADMDRMHRRILLTAIVSIFMGITIQHFT